MLPKKRRIERKEFDFILKNSHRYNSPHLLLYIAPNNSDTTRFSFSISKKIYKHAVDRNLNRRRGYSVIRPIIDTISPGYLLFFTFKRGIYPLSFLDLQNEIIHLLRTSRVII